MEQDSSIKNEERWLMCLLKIDMKSRQIYRAFDSRHTFTFSHLYFYLLAGNLICYLSLNFHSNSI